jgi:hypothetical protein
MALSEHREGLEQLEATSPANVQEDPSREELDAALRALEVAGARERSLTKQVETLEERLLEVETELARAELEADRRSALIDEIKATSSWRITAPLRALNGFLRR